MPSGKELHVPKSVYFIVCPFSTRHETYSAGYLKRQQRKLLFEFFVELNPFTINRDRIDIGCRLRRCPAVAVVH